jgi:hypothetical protein
MAAVDSELAARDTLPRLNAIWLRLGGAAGSALRS